MKTTRKQRDDIKSFIQDELLKRGFTASINFLDEVKDKDESYLIFSTDSFQTTPVIFKSIHVENFSSSIGNEEQTESGIPYFPFFISVHARYEHFDLGSNGCNLFNVKGRIFKETVRGLQAY